MSESLKAKDKMLDEGRTVCLHCGYAGEEIQGNYPNLWQGYGCPICHSCLVVLRAIGKEGGLRFFEFVQILGRMMRREPPWSSSFFWIVSI